MKSTVKPILIITTGGSLDKTYDLATSDFLVGPPQIERMLQEANVRVPYIMKEFIRKDSLEITESDRSGLKRLIEAETATQIVITHGTDTLHLTGQFLSTIRDKVIVLTGSMQPASFKDTDAHFNVGGAILLVQQLPPGAHVVFNGQVFNPFFMKKNREKRCFEQI